MDTPSRPRRHLAVLAAACLLVLAAGIAAVPVTASNDDPGPVADGEKLERLTGSASAIDLPSVPLASANVEHVANVPGATGGHTVVEGDRLYVGAYGLGMRIFSLADPALPVEIGRWFPGPQGPDDPGARADTVPDAAVFDGRHIVALGGTARTSGTTQTEFLDVTDAADPQLLWRFTGDDDGEAHNSDIVDERRLWLPSGGAGENGLRIYDLEPLLGAEPAAPSVLFRGDPVALWESSPYRFGRDVGPEFTHTHDVEVYTDLPVKQASGDTELRDVVLMAEGGSYLGAGNTGSILVVDITDPGQPVVLNRWLHTGADDIGTEHHPIRYFHEVQLLDGDQSVMIITDEDLHSGCDAAGVTVVRLSPGLTQATELSEWFIGTGTPAPVCSSHVFSTRGHHMYMGAYNAGLQIIDLSDPANPTRAGQHIPAGANYWGALVHGDYVYAGDFGSRGLDVFAFTPSDG